MSRPQPEDSVTMIHLLPYTTSTHGLLKLPSESRSVCVCFSELDRQTSQHIFTPNHELFHRDATLDKNSMLLRLPINLGSFVVVFRRETRPHPLGLVGDGAVQTE